MLQLQKINISSFRALAGPKQSKLIYYTLFRASDFSSINLSKHQPNVIERKTKMGKVDQNQEKEATSSPLYDDLLGEIFSHVPLIDLVPASYVSKSWRCTVSSCLLRNPTRTKPWLIIHIQSPWNPSATAACAYDPNSHVWTEINGAATSYASPLRSSHSNSLYMLTPSRFTFSFDPLNEKWCDVSGPHVWRSDPIVAVVGSQVVVAGGTSDFEDDPLAVEIFDMDTQKWETCQPMPIILKDSAATTWLSVAVSGQELYLLEKYSGTFCSFDPKTKTWGGTFDLRPKPSIYFSVIGYSGDRLFLVGLTGERTENTESLTLWEVNSDTFDCTEIGYMPSPMLEKLKNPNLPLLSVDISVADNFIYIYDSSDPKEIFFCEFKSGNCEWGSITNSFLNDRARMDRFVFTCSRVDINDLQKVYRSGIRKFTAKQA